MKQLSCGVVIMAAGLGKRMHSSIPKVLHEAGGRPILFHILHTIKSALPGAPVAIIVGHGRELVERAVRGCKAFPDMNLEFVQQCEQLGTGHAVKCAMESKWGSAVISQSLPVLVMPGDSPLVTGALVAELAAPMKRGDVMRLLTCEVDDPHGYGRIARRGKHGPVLRIVEENEATAREKEIREVAVSMYLFRPAFLNASLARLSNKNNKREYYLTDLVSQAVRSKKKIDVLKWHSAAELMGVNDPYELSVAARLLNGRKLRALAVEGVRFVDPCCTIVDADVEIEEDVTVWPGAILQGWTRIGRGAVIGPRVVLKDVTVGPGANIKAGTVAEKSTIGERAQIGPYAHLRPDSVVGNEAKIGNFVELKKATIGAKTSVAHLSYVGDAELGERVNIGCGFITCNFDGRVIDGERKHKSIIEDDVFMGSDCQIVAPIRIGKGAYVASGSTITENVEADSLAIARTRQVTKPGYAKKLRGEAS